MIKDFKTYIEEGTLWGNTILRSDTDRVRKEDVITEDYVKRYISHDFIKKIYSITIRKDNGKQIVDVVGDVYLVKDITEIPFQFGEIKGSFYCGNSKLTTLKGCPEKVSGHFNCAFCKDLYSIEYMPKSVGLYVRVHNCGKKFTEEEVYEFCPNIGKGVYL